MTPYELSLADDFGGGINEGKLKDEVNSNGSIVPHCSDVGVSGDVVTITFLGPLSAADQTELETVVLPAHDSTPTPNDTALVEVVNQPPAPPVTSEGTPIVQPNVVPPGYYFWGTGAFDDVAGVKIGEGDQIAWECAGPAQTATHEGRFFHHVYVLGGTFRSILPGLHDWISLEIYAPASVPEDRTLTHDGNANKVATGLGFNIIVPAVGGDWNVDGTTMEVGEINLNLCPVPSDGNGFWNWDPAASPSITPVANPGAPDGNYNLYDIPLPLARQANRYPCLVDGSVTPTAAIKGKKILPHWIWKFSLRRELAGTVGVAIRLDLARKLTL